MRICAICLLLISGVPVMADESLLHVEYIPVQRDTLTWNAALTGTIEAIDSVDLGFRQGGRVTKVLVGEGDRVKAGDALARTDPLQQDQALNTATAALAAAQAGHDQAQQAFDRASAMLARGVGTRASRDQAQQVLSQTEGAVERATTAVDQARRALNDTILRAPADAVVTERHADPGQIVAAAQKVISLAGLSGFEAVFHAPNLPTLDDAIGVRITLTTIDIKAPEMTAQVTEISPLVDPLTGTVTVKARIDGQTADPQLLGATVRGRVHLDAGEGIEIPWTALSRLGDQPAVWLISDDDVVTLTPIRIERFSNGSVVIADGLTPGQTIVGAGSQMMYPDRHVQPAATGQEGEK